MQYHFSQNEQFPSLVCPFDSSVTFEKPGCGIHLIKKKQYLKIMYFVFLYVNSGQLMRFIALWITIEKLWTKTLFLFQSKTIGIRFNNFFANPIY